MVASALFAVAAVLAGVPAAYAEQLYSKDTPVMQINGRDAMNQLINKSNRTSIIEFYAPWCGHCQNLKKPYEKAAQSLHGLANVAAVNCDDEINKELCGVMGVKGFPTLKIARPSKVAGRHPALDDYNGARTASGIVDAVLLQMNNHVTKVTDETAEAFLTAHDGPKALLFTEKGTTAPLVKGLAIDFLGVISVGQVRHKESETVAKFGVEKFPALVLLPGGDGDKEPVLYNGEMKRDAMIAFLSQAGEPNKAAEAATPPKKAAKSGKKDKKDKKDSKAKKEKKSKAETEDAKAETETNAETETKTASTPTEQQTAPVIVESALPIPTIHTPEKLNSGCLSPKSPTCVLVFVGSDAAAADANADSAKTKASQEALDNLSELAHKYAQNKRHLFPFYAVPDSNTASATLINALGLDTSSSQVQLVAVNARRGWWRHYDGGDDLSHESIERWVDDIRMGDGTKQTLPEGLIVNAEKKEDAKHEEL